MKLSKQTIELLSSFADINQSILVKGGSKLSTISVSTTILAEAEVKENFPCEFAIYELPTFLKALRLFQDPDLSFASNYVTISEGKDRLRYYFADKNVIISPPDDKLELPSEEVNLQINDRQLAKLLQAASLLDLPDLSVIGSNGDILLTVGDKKNGSSNSWQIEVGKTDSKFCFNFKIENLKIYPGTYDVTISSHHLSHWNNVNQNLSYFVALEQDSEFE